MVYKVDDTKSFTIMPHLEGKAQITNIDAPDTYKVDQDLRIVVAVKNTGDTDTLFIRITCPTTGDTFPTKTKTVSAGSTWTQEWWFSISKDVGPVELKVEAGHIE